MKWVLLVVILLAVVLFAIGHYIDKTSRSADEAIAASIPWIIALALVLLDVVLAGAWVLWRSFQ